MRKMLLLNQGRKKNRVSILTEKFREEELFPYLLSTGKFGYNALRDIPIRPARYFNEK